MGSSGAEDATLAGSTVTTRSELMGRIRGKDTGPELVVRRLVHALGYRFRLHRRDLPGSPDLVLSRHRKVIFVHGCFWHRHSCKRGQSMPATRVAFWSQKFRANQLRDRAALIELRRLGWRTLIIWECETVSARRVRLENRVRRFLESN